MKPKKNEVELIKSILTKVIVDPDKGSIKWAMDIKSVKKGDEAGYVDVAGYRACKHKGFKLKCHRVIFYYVNQWLPAQLDHINRVKDDNRIDNLRATTASLNARNIGVRKTSKSGITGVFFNKVRNTYQAQITVNCKQLHLGNHKTIESATQARKEAELKYFGEYAPS